MWWPEWDAGLVEGGAGPAYRGARQSPGVVFDVAIDVGGGGDDGEGVGGVVVGDGLDLFAGGVGVAQQGAWATVRTAGPAPRGVCAAMVASWSARSPGLW